MAALHSQTEAVKSAVSSISTCSPTTTVLLKDLLLPRDGEDTSETRNSDSRATKTVRGSKLKVNGSTKVTSKATKAAASGDGKEELSAKEKAILATHVINVTLKSLGDAAKSPPATPSRKAAAGGELAKTANRNALRRSISSPTTPLHPRSLNRISTSPAVTTKQNKAPPSLSSSNGCLSTVECARIAFSALRTLQSTAKIALPEYQLETGMSSFVGRLIGLGMCEQALKELRTLKKRLDSTSSSEARKSAKAAATEKTTLSQSIAELLDFRQAKLSGQALTLVITTQLQVLRILSKLKRPSAVESAVPFLRESCKTSPVSLLLASAKASPADKAKAARQLETLSQLLLSLTPSVSNTDDATALESRLSISPTDAFELQSLGLLSRLHWWKLAAHTADADKDIFSPMSRCLGAYLRRIRSSGTTNYQLCHDSFKRILSEVKLHDIQYTLSSKSPIAVIYQAFTTLSREGGKLAEAITWAEKLKGVVNATEDTPAKCCAVASQLLALHLKEPWKHLHNESLLREVLDGAQGPLKGDSSELDELLTNLAMVRRSALNILLGQLLDHDGKKYQPTVTIRDLLESFILQLPRFCLRWIGKPPASKGNAKDFLRFEQRRQFLLKSLYPTFDSAMMLVKTRLDEQVMIWDQLDSILHDCLTILEHIGDNATSESAGAYYIKISHLYYMQHKNLCQSQDPGSKDMSAVLRALRRSIDSVKYRPSKEKEKAQLSFKLERMVELSKAAGRNEEALAALQSIRTCLLEDGILGTIAETCKTQSVAVAWASSDKAETLSRTICSISRMEPIWVDWTIHLDEQERLAALEHRLQFIILGSRKRQSLVGLSDPCVSALLDLYPQDRFPVRRLRVLLRLLIANIGNINEFEGIKSAVEETANFSTGTNLGEDTSLQNYIQHLQAMQQSVRELASSEPDFNVIRWSTSTWQCLLSTCQTKSDLLHRVDDVPALLEHLRSIADCLRLSSYDDMLVTVLQLVADISKLSSESNIAESTEDCTALALQLIDVGQSSRAAEIFEQLQQWCQKGYMSSPEIIIECHLSYSEYFLTVGEFDKAEEYLLCAKEASAVEQSGLSKSRRKALIAYASLLYSLVALGRGEVHRALSYARNGVRLLFQDWTRLEQALTSNKLETITTSTDKAETEEDTSLAMSTTTPKVSIIEPKQVSGPDFWRLAKPILRSLLSLSSLYAHLGMHQETIYYAEQAQKIALSLHSPTYLAQCESWIAMVSAWAAKPERSLEMARAAQSKLPDGQSSCQLVDLVCRLGNTYRELKESSLASEMIEKAESILDNMRSKSSRNIAEIEISKIEAKLSTLSMNAKPVKGAKRAKPTATRSAPKKAAAKPRAPSPSAVLDSDELSITRVKASILLEKGSSMIVTKDWSNAMDALGESYSLSKQLPESSVGLVAMAQTLLGQSLEQMAKDSVLSVVQESTLSFPSICNGATEKIADRTSLAKASPPRKGRAAATSQERINSKGRNNGYLENLEQAREYLLEAHSIAAVTGDGRLVHHILGMMQTVVILLSAASPGKKSVLGHPGYATYSVEMARNLTWRRERKALLIEQHAPKPGGLDWPEQIKSPESRRASLGFSLDINKLQKDYIDIIPPNWTAISISLSENKHDLCITKLQADQSPFVIRLPLERANSRDADNEIFNFQQGRTELLEVIRLANETCHDARDMTVKGAKSAWWADREGLDNRMRELLENIESIWLGGFKGIFSQHQRRSDLLARFQKSFQNVLDKHLPSRRQVRGKKNKSAAPKVTLDPRILELFIGLGDATEPECDFDDALNDLLYFVVDILQFHGERNAYDEIDFDSMVVETFDALHSYHSAVKNDLQTERGAHTILILDKALHVFPWESLPCMQGQAVSRVPSLACLRRLILEQRSTAGDFEGSAESAKPSGHSVCPKTGSYILNPGADLKTTQATFEKPLASLGSSWKRVVSRAPTEAEFETALTDSDILLYFGHGSGAQYIRGRTIRKLEKCRATVLLMGCSSASLADVGDFECHGPVWNYMLAGCPAVVGTLWDVTDRDIDRYAGRVLEEWGLMKKGTFVEKDKGKGKGKSKTNAEDSRPAAARRRAATPEGSDGEHGKASLVEAVARARGACRFRYLTAAAVCVYGVPVYVDK